MMLDFQPPKPKISGIFATYIPTRRPQFKSHTNIGHAKNALGGYGDSLIEGICYELRDGEWVELWRTSPAQHKYDHPAYRERIIKEDIKNLKRQIKWILQRENKWHSDERLLKKYQDRLHLLEAKAKEYGIVIRERSSK